MQRADFRRDAEQQRQSGEDQRQGDVARQQQLCNQAASGKQRSADD